MNPLTTLLSRLRLLISSPREQGQLTGRVETHGRQHEADQAQVNRLMMVKIAWSFSFLLFLASFAQDGNHLQLFERLLNTCALADVIIAVISKNKWSIDGLSRWDEAILFATISLGLQIFA
ncbi:hypothetical protein [Lichenifustis flavocetrariae]|uniref:Uncharacterized protein n=1 Tax=Lichenifustis flavocetrariae TaxID=2949735 RepID=A0AA42CNP1_9HYPH|nr:hypothetical protein [Lichenifustis flavocetrariae]MCW6513006.1 hypothetical protein [Lichenifustis flavocetrariae]